MQSVSLVNILRQRSSGILLPVFSLPSPHGIGDLGQTAQLFIEFLLKSGQRCWQILPLGPTTRVFGNSPYMSFSSLAGNPLLISPDHLLSHGLVNRSDIPDLDYNEYLVDYQGVVEGKRRILRSAWQRFSASGKIERLEAFAEQHPWVRDHALFLALKAAHNEQAWYAWPKGLRRRDRAALLKAHNDLRSQVLYFIFEQYLFFKQWDELRTYANARGISIIGDLPIYVALDSADVWANQEIFHLDAEGRPTEVAGVPPDYFSRNGQLWGNPLYRWNGAPGVAAQLFDWWENRLRATFAMVDVVRIDHFRGFESYWSVPAHEETAINGSWLPGPGAAFFRDMESRLGGDLPIIAEDLGLITPEVESLRDTLGYPGMKVLLFAFDGATDNNYLPHRCPRHSVVYTGTHDNDTAVGWYLSPDVMAEAKQRAKHYANQQDQSPSIFHRDMIHLAMSSPANLAIFPMQDVLGFGNDCRINIPGTSRGNWRWRLAARFMTEDLAEWLHGETLFFGRANPTQPNQAS